MSPDAPDGPAVTPERLMAYADDALPPSEAAEVVRRMAADPELEVEVQAYRNSRNALSSAYDDVLSEPVPDHLQALVLGGSAKPSGSASGFVSLDPVRGKPERGGRLPTWLPAVAAGCAGLAIGVLIGSGWNRDDGTRPVHGFLHAGAVDSNSTLGHALDTAASARDVALGGGRFTAIQTFQTDSGELCREYEASSSTGAVIGVACRSEARWLIEAVIASGEPAAGSGTAFRSASGPGGAALEGVLGDLGARPGLGVNAESCLLEADWIVAECTRAPTRGSDLLIVHIAAPEESDPELVGDLALEDSESAAMVPVSLGRSDLDRYRERRAQWSADVARRCREVGGRYLSLEAGDDVEQAMLREWRTSGVLR